MKTIRIFLLLVFAALSTRAQDSLAVENIEKRLREVEIKTQMEGLIDKRVELAEQSFQNQFNQSWMAFGATILAALAALGISAKALYENAKSFARQKVEEEIQTIVLKDKELIRRAIDLHALETRLIREAKIGVIAVSSHGSYTLASFFEELQFPALPPLLPVTKEGDKPVFPSESMLKGFDVLIIDNHLSEIEKRGKDPDFPFIQEFVLSAPKPVSLFYYGPGVISLENASPRRQSLFAAANLKAQVYPNLLNLLKMKQLLSPKP